MKKLERSYSDRKISGVCAGIAKYLQIDVTIIRVAFVVGAFAWGICLILYAVLWVVMPEEKVDYSSYFGTQSSGTTTEPLNENPFTDSNSVENPFSEKKTSNFSVAVGIILILFGSIMLLSNFISFLDFSDLFPIVFVAIGVMMIINSFNKRTPKGGEL